MTSNLTLFKKRGSKIVLLILVSIICGIIIVLTPYYLPAQKQISYKVKSKYGNDTLRIGFLGDSWANLQHTHIGVLDSIAKLNISSPFKLYANGAPGAKSKEIYYNMFKSTLSKNKDKYRKNFEEILEKKLNYCIISAGVNDASTKVGSDFYEKNMNLIINHLINIGTVPVIIEIPSFNIENAYEITSFSTKILRRISMFINNDNINCIEKYRNSLYKMLSKYNLWDKIIFVSYTEWNKDGYLDNRNIYLKDGIHLNTKGYQILDKCIIQKITNHYNLGKSNN